jgi:signal transduction histidine kinase
MTQKSLRPIQSDLGAPLPVCRRLLLVDDLPPNLVVLKSLLMDDYDVAVAATGEEALAILAADGPVDLVISDQRMPGITGVELLSRVSEAYPSTLGIVLTGYTDLEPMRAAAKLDLVYRFLLKPYDPAELRAVVAAALEQKAWADALRELVAALDDQRRALAESTAALEVVREQLAAEARLDLLGRLVDGVLRDLRAQADSLSPVLGMIRQRASEPELLSVGQQAWEGLANLKELLDQVRTYVDVTSAEFDPQPVATRALMQEVMERFLREGLGHRCPVRAQHDLGASELVVDKARMVEILLALLRNGARASKPGVPLEVHFQGIEDGCIAIDIADRGHGMAAKDLARATAPFYRRFEAPGLGLGLDIARLVAESHGGKLEVESREDIGTVATILLPGTPGGAIDR